MPRHSRREEILEYLKNNKTVSCDELCGRFDVTRETIRQDLNSLSEQGLVVRTFGGAMIAGEPFPSLEQRVALNMEEKHRIAKAALQYIRPNDLMVMDAGSTIVELAKIMGEGMNLVVLTNSLEILRILAQKSGVHAIGTGGSVFSHSMSFQGRNAENMISSYNLRKAFISAEALSFKEGIMDTNEGEACIKRAMIEAAGEVTLLIDHTKFTKMGHITVCPVTRINRIITGSGVDPETIEMFLGKGIEFVVV